MLASFSDCLVVVGGWVPDLLLTDAEEPHIGSIDVDLALDVAKLNEGRYAELLKLLLDTKRYRKGAKDFQLMVEIILLELKTTLPNACLRRAFGIQADFVIEGYVDPSSLRYDETSPLEKPKRSEGPFADHTGYYTLTETVLGLDIAQLSSSGLSLMADLIAFRLLPK